MSTRDWLCYKFDKPKFAYRSEAQAQWVAGRMRDKAHAFLCPYCKWWHLSSDTSPGRSRVRKFLAEPAARGEARP